MGTVEENDKNAGLPIQRIVNSELGSCRRIGVFTLTVFTALVIYLTSGACENAKSSDIRPAAVDGKFYPDDPQKLKTAIERFLQSSTKISMEKPVALISPHAGYIYSGQIAADAYKQVMGHSYDVAVILGVNHTVGGFNGISVGNYDAFTTPLGNVSVDKEIVSALLSENKECTTKNDVHISEHSIEVQIPFLQVLFPKIKIVPVIIHPPDYKMCIRFGETLTKVLKNRNALIVISSDLSHYPDAKDAAKVDRETIETIMSLDTTRIASIMKALDVSHLDTRACGEAGILAGVTAAKALGATRAVVAGYANSGDVPVGDSERTVGYGAIILTKGIGSSNTEIMNRPAAPSSATPLLDSEKKALLAFARETIHNFLTTQTLPLTRNFPARMYFPQGAFVTLKKSGNLRGCIGNMSGNSPLVQTIGKMALYAALKDTRFTPVKPEELKSLEIEISVLTPLKPVDSADKIVIGRDGVYLSKAGSSAVFLPQVAVENHWSRSETLDHLCVKAGLENGCWKRDAHFQVFQADVFGE